jgi:hypothetical protein
VGDVAATAGYAQGAVYANSGSHPDEAAGAVARLVDRLLAD